jgi:hypothetical protein
MFDGAPPRQPFFKRLFNLFGTERTDMRGSKFILLMNRYKLLADSQNYTIPPVIEELFARCPDPAALSGLEYSWQVTDKMTWSEVDLLEEAVIGITPNAELVEQLRAYRLVYAGTVNSTEYGIYKDTMCDLTLAGATNGPSFDRVRSELLAITQRVKYILEQEPPKESARALLTLWNISIMLAAILAVVVTYLWNPLIRQEQTTQTIVVVMLVGLLGGFISVQQRLQEPTNVDPLLKWLDLKWSGFSLLLSPVIGMVFAVVIFAIFAGGFVTGSIVPNFACDKAAHGALCKGHDFYAFAISSVPASSADWAKLAVWAFAAGFLERLVPDILTRIAATADVKK